jgi:hypothetical protein
MLRKSPRGDGDHDTLAVHHLLALLAGECRFADEDLDREGLRGEGLAHGRCDLLRRRA